MPFELIDKEKLKKMGYADSIKYIERGICPECRKKVNVHSFSNDFYRREFEICGYCENCTKKAMEGVRKNRDNNTCFRCGDAIILEDFHTIFELEMYEKIAVCANCQRKLVEMFMKISDLKK